MAHSGWSLMLKHVLAEDDLVADGDERRRQGSRLGVRGAQQVVGQPLGGLRADARAGARTTR